MPFPSNTWARGFGRLAGVAMTVSLAGSFAAACGGSTSTPAKTPTTTSTVSTQPTTTTPTTSPPSPAPSGGTASGPADPAAAAAQVKKNWEAFFDPATPLSAKGALLEGGAQLQPLIQGFASDARVGQVKATVTNVTFDSPTSATVTYSLSLQGTVVEPNATGKAVLQDGTWKVSRTTLCGLVALAGVTSAPGCT